MKLWLVTDRPLVTKCHHPLAGDPLTINISVVSLPNTPLDLYILMDLSDSMGPSFASVKSVSQAIGKYCIIAQTCICRGGFKYKTNFNHFIHH